MNLNIVLTRFHVALIHRRLNQHNFARLVINPSNFLMGVHESIDLCPQNKIFQAQKKAIPFEIKRQCRAFELESFNSLMSIRMHNSLLHRVIWKTQTTWTRTTRTRTRKKSDKKQSKRKMRKKSYHTFYKVTILCEIIVRVRVWVAVRVRVSMLSVSVLSVFSRFVVRVFQITTTERFFMLMLQVN